MQVAMTKQEARAAIFAVMETHPDLGASGFLQGDGHDHLSEWKDPEKRRADRLMMLSSPCVKEFIRSLEFIADCDRYKSPGRGHSSYALKHIAERTHGGYIANGMLIAAAIHLGVPIVERYGPNAVLPLKELRTASFNLRGTR